MAAFPRTAQAVEYWSNRAKRSVRKVAHQGMSDSTIEAIAHELAHLALNSYDEAACYELQISWLQKLIERQRRPLIKGMKLVLYRNMWITLESLVVRDFYDKSTF